MENIWSRRGKWLLAPDITIGVIGQKNCIQQKRENSIIKSHIFDLKLQFCVFI